MSSFAVQEDLMKVGIDGISRKRPKTDNFGCVILVSHLLAVYECGS